METKKLSFDQMEMVNGGITLWCLGNAVLVASSILAGAWLGTAGLLILAIDHGCLDDWEWDGEY